MEEIRMISHLGKPVVWSGSLPKNKKGAYGRVYDRDPDAVRSSDSWTNQEMTLSCMKFSITSGL